MTDTVWLLVIFNPVSGMDVTGYSNDVKVYLALYDYVKENWGLSEELPEDKTLAIEMYFKYSIFESFVVTQIEVK